MAEIHLDKWLNRIFNSCQHTVYMSLQHMGHLVGLGRLSAKRDPCRRVLPPLRHRRGCVRPPQGTHPTLPPSLPVSNGPLSFRSSWPTFFPLHHTFVNFVTVTPAPKADPSHLLASTEQGGSRVSAPLYDPAAHLH